MYIFAYQNLRTCLKKAREASAISSQRNGTRPRPAENPVCRDNDVEESRNVIWRDNNVCKVSKMILEKNLFMLPTGGVAKLYISEINDLIIFLFISPIRK